MTQAEYARHAGVSRALICKLVKVGMPLTSPEAADAFRGSFHRGPKGLSVVHESKQPSKQDGTPNESGPFRPPESTTTVDPSLIAADTVQGSYERQRQIERAAFGLAVESLRSKTLDASRIVAVHALAARNLTAARNEVLTLNEREKTLVSGDWVRRAMTEHDGAVISLAKAMPRQLSGRISPHDPEHCEKELDRWVQEVFLKTLHDSNPWK